MVVSGRVIAAVLIALLRPAGVDAQLAPAKAGAGAGQKMATPLLLLTGAGLPADSTCTASTGALLYVDTAASVPAMWLCAGGQWLQVGDVCSAGRPPGQIVTGGAGAVGHLDLKANGAAFDASTPGRIRLFERLQLLPEDMTLSDVTVAIQTPSKRVYTMNNLKSVFEMMNMSTELRYTASPFAGAGPVMASWPGVIRATTTPITLSPALYRSTPVLVADGVPFTLGDSSPAFEDHPILSVVNSGTFGASSAWTSYRSGADIKRGASLNQRRALHIEDAGGPGELTTQIGVDLDALAKGATNISLRSAGATATMRHAGPAIFGSADSEPAAALHVRQARAGTEVLRAETETTNDDPNYRILQYRQTTIGAVTSSVLATYTPRDDAVTLLEARVVSRCTANCTTVGTGGAGTLVGRFRRSGAQVTRIGDDTAPVAFAEDTDGTLGVDFSPTASGTIEVRATAADDADVNLLWHVTLIAQDAGT